MRKVYVVFFLSLFFPLMAWSSVQDEVIEKVEISLDEMEKNWNAGNLQAFLNVYNHSKSTAYIGDGTIIYGYKNIIKRFYIHYPTPEKMGQLKLSHVKITVLSEDYATVVGHWHLTRNHDPDLGGIFSELYEKTEKGWKIDLDHTS